MKTRLHTTPDLLSDGHRPEHTASAKWEQFAQEDPYSYILTALKEADIGEFWRSGERTIQKEFVPLLEAHNVRPVLALELGCGVGRLAVPLAHRFREVVGVDISRGMIERATSFAHDNGIDNVSYAAISGPVDFLRQAAIYAGRCDFIYSLLVFQHIPDFSVIEGYLHVIRHLLHKQGFAYLQFDTREKTFAYRLKTRLPDFLLPRFWRRGIRRIRRSQEDIEVAMRRAGLEIVGERTPHTAYHRHILRPAKATAGSK
jgi:SAM-dependent methyltransferase